MWRLADLVDAGQANGTLAAHGRPSKTSEGPRFSESGLSWQDVHEARAVRAWGCQAGEPREPAGRSAWSSGCMPNELLEALAELPRVDWPVADWADPPDPDSEYRFALAVASPEPAQRIRVTVEECVEHAGGLGELVAMLDWVAVRFGQDGDAETCAALLDLSTCIRDWVDR
jgi:hypothetical protein